ncbi:MAG: class I SAM-dependent methyltransferase [Thiomicrospira sp.]|uniref:SAM-dependent methyltransferase n=1 Tax=Thiomicrospira sp. TaxID=935 RepID=UPI0019E51DA5|nr:cyclopropane-fatty-acyl-phospholipid synthase family protein [Thiomicrospira sp.]MBE0493318.1 class I SAM-dependent methyltransferase [Thiomicrospira sp.]
MLSKTQSHTLSSKRAPFYGAMLLKKLPFNQLNVGSLTVKIGEHQHRFNGQQAGVHADLILLKPLTFMWLLVTQGELGFAKAYANGLIETSNLHSLLKLGADNETALARTLKGHSWFYKRLLKRHQANHNSIENSRENISAHYDLGNDFYQLWLDSSMSYSSALFKHPEQDLTEAQVLKYQRILHALDFEEGEHILEIGCGWGGFAEQAARQGAKISGITLSREQLEFAKHRLRDAGLDHQACLSLTDYRHQDGQFDHIVSIEMFEAVGKEYWNDYFEQLKRCLKPGGKAVLQIITIDEDYADAYQNGVDFIQTYIFPGGLLPSKTQLHELAQAHGFNVTNELAFGQDYADTLNLWRQRFDQQRPALEKLGYDARFQRIWHYYLDYCRVGFETQRTDVVQITLEHAL